MRNRYFYQVSPYQAMIKEAGLIGGLFGLGKGVFNLGKGIVNTGVNAVRGTASTLGYLGKGTATLARDVVGGTLNTAGRFGKGLGRWATSETPALARATIGAPSWKAIEGVGRLGLGTAKLVGRAGLNLGGRVMHGVQRLVSGPGGLQRGLAAGSGIYTFGNAMHNGAAYTNVPEFIGNY